MKKNKTLVSLLIVIIMLIVAVTYGCTNNDIVEYTINFSSDGVIYYSITTDGKSEITLPVISQSIPQKENHTFEGWYWDDNTFERMVTVDSLKDEPITENITVYAKWTENPPATTYTIAFESNGGSSVAAITQAAGTAITAPTPTRDNYTFDGWYTDDNTFIDAYTFDTMPAESFTLYAKWTANPPVTYTITFESNGGSSVAAITQAAGTAITAPTPTRDDYTFDGWYTDDDTFADAYTFDTMPEESFTLYAKWTANPPATTYTITFESNGGSSVAAITQAAGTAITAPTPTRDNYTFDGWYTDDDTFADAYTFDTMPAESFTLYAKWTPVEGAEESVMELLWLDIKDVFAEIWSDCFESELEVRIYEVRISENIIIKALMIEGEMPVFIACLKEDEEELQNHSEDFVFDIILVGETEETYIFVVTMLSIDKMVAGDVIEQDDVYFDSEKSHIIRYKGESESYTIPDTVVSIGYMAFDACDELTAVYIPLNVSNISAAAFSCDDLTIYTETAIAPIGWDEDWNIGYADVVWGYNIEPITYTFVVDGGSEVNDIIAVRIEESPYTENDGFYFGGWYDNSSFEGKPITFPYYSDTATILYAYWSDTIILDGKTFETAFVVETDELVEVDLQSSLSAIYYSFVPQTSGYYVIESFGYVDTYINLYASFKNWIAADDDSGNRNNFRLIFELEAEEMYYLEIDTYNRRGTYTFDIKAYEPQAGEIFGTAIEIEAGEEVEATLSSSSNSIYYSFVPNNSTKYIIHTNGNNEIRITIYTDDYNEIMYGSGYVRVEFESGNTYYIEIHSYSWTGEVTVVVEEYEAQVGDTIDNPIELTIGELINVEFESSYYSIYYVFEVEVSGYYIIESYGDIDTWVWLYDSFENLKDYDNNSGESWNFRLVVELETEETYYLEIGINQDHGTCTFDIQEYVPQAGETFTTAIEIEAGEEVEAALSSSSNSIYYFFVPQTSGYYIVESYGDMDTWIDLFDSFESWIDDNDDSGESYNFRLFFECEQGKPYYIKLGAFESGTFTFEIKEYEPEPGETFGTAVAIEVDNEVEVELLSSSWKYYSFIPQVSAVYVIESSGDVDSWVALFDNSKDELNYDDDSGVFLNFRLVIELEAGATYYLKVGAWGSGGTCTFDIQEYVPEPGETFGTAIAIEVDEEVEVEVSWEYQVFYSFVPQTSGYYVIESYGFIDTLITLYDGSQSYIADNDDSGQLYNFKLIIELEEGETYYLEVGVWDDGGTFTFDIKEYNN